MKMGSYILLYSHTFEVYIYIYRGIIGGKSCHRCIQLLSLTDLYIFVSLSVHVGLPVTIEAPTLATNGNIAFLVMFQKVLHPEETIPKAKISKGPQNPQAGRKRLIGRSKAISKR